MAPAETTVIPVPADGRRVDRVGHTGGRPLGLELLPTAGRWSATHAEGCWLSTRALATSSSCSLRWAGSP